MPETVLGTGEYILHPAFLDSMWGVCVCVCVCVCVRERERERWGEKQ